MEEGECRGDREESEAPGIARGLGLWECESVGGWERARGSNTVCQDGGKAGGGGTAWMGNRVDEEVWYA